MILYSQQRGELTLPDGTVLGGCYSGGGVLGYVGARNQYFRNNPETQSVKDFGPLPQGHYTISPAHTIPHLGPVVMALTPALTNTMYGRSGFFIHGDNAAQNFTASDGCIVAPVAVRAAVAAIVENDNQLTVTA